ncbi:hypothetical protein [Pseudokordiimonas caeni]|uniref:hypothetical protein n=1 Tax=Pseudokordiimonas caeni TaxID=2997908 RepID=UPI002811D64D|nr:hypothetical protein [Pseudokordiimonas caeni]
MILTTSKTVTFAHPFTVEGFDEVIAAGTYNVDYEEEVLAGQRVAAAVRKRVHIFLNGREGGPGVSRMLTLNADSFALALNRDIARVRAAAQQGAGGVSPRAPRPQTSANWFDQLALARANDVRSDFN